MPATKPTRLVRATTSFASTIGKVEYVIHGGEVVPRAHPVAKAHPELFADYEPEKNTR
jgi:hypothetical protein